MVVNTVNFLLILLCFCAGAAGSLIGGAISVLIGGLGATRLLARRLTQLEDDQELLQDRMTTEVKRRAGKSRVEKDDLNSELAELITKGLVSPFGGQGGMMSSPILPGRGPVNVPQIKQTAA